MDTAEDWDELLLPEIERPQAEREEVAFRADAVFAKPEIYEALEASGVKCAIRIPATEDPEGASDGQRQAIGTPQLRWGCAGHRFSCVGVRNSIRMREVGVQIGNLY
jgi:hypothetical protein